MKNINEELLEALYKALPIVEDSVLDPCYKKGYVNSILKTIEKAIELAEKNK